LEPLYYTEASLKLEESLYYMEMGVTLHLV
jgi:hypothetical protein